MLKFDDNELITRVGPGTPMGEMLREYWTPAYRASALEAGGAPIRVRLLGENFVAFRGDSGKVGFMDERCPHRSASMALARNEDDSLRCIFHGWKINMVGKVIDTPCEPAHTREAFAATIKTRVFPAREAGGMLWVYLGKRETPPPFPTFDFNVLPLDHVYARRAVTNYNWFQGVEAHVDASHLGVLHSGWVAGRPAGSDLVLAAANVSPEIQMDVTAYGLREGALRDQGDGNTYSRIRQIALPYFTFIPASPTRPNTARATVPIDDEWDAEWYIEYDLNKPLTAEFLAQMRMGASDNPDNFAANLGNRGNTWEQDRVAMSNGHFSGLTKNVPFEDFIVQESLGPTVDRSKEQLGVADAFIVRVRRILLEALHDYQQGKPAKWLEGFNYNEIRATAVTHPTKQDWRDCVPKTRIITEQMAAE